MATIVVASANPVKVQAARLAFERMFPGQSFQARGVAVPSGIPAQPLSSAETLRGARNRARAAALAAPGADFYVGMEGGVEQSAQGWASFSWIAVRGAFPEGASAAEGAETHEAAELAEVAETALEGVARSGMFFLPPAVGELIRQGKELGEADDIVFGRSNSKQENGAIGILTGDVIDRVELYAHAVILALVPFKNPGLYGG